MKEKQCFWPMLDPEAKVPLSHSSHSEYDWSIAGFVTVRLRRICMVPRVLGNLGNLEGFTWYR